MLAPLIAPLIVAGDLPIPVFPLLGDSVVGLVTKVYTRASRALQQLDSSSMGHGYGDSYDMDGHGDDVGTKSLDMVMQMQGMYCYSAQAKEAAARLLKQELLAMMVADLSADPPVDPESMPMTQVVDCLCQNWNFSDPSFLGVATLVDQEDAPPSLVLPALEAVLPHVLSTANLCSSTCKRALAATVPALLYSPFREAQTHGSMPAREEFGAIGASAIGAELAAEANEQLECICAMDAAGMLKDVAPVIEYMYLVGPSDDEAEFSPPPPSMWGRRLQNLGQSSGGEGGANATSNATKNATSNATAQLIMPDDYGDLTATMSGVVGAYFAKVALRPGGFCPALCHSDPAVEPWWANATEPRCSPPPPPPPASPLEALPAKGPAPPPKDYASCLAALGVATGGGGGGGGGGGAAAAAAVIFALLFVVAAAAAYHYYRELQKSAQLLKRAVASAPDFAAATALPPMGAAPLAAQDV